MQKIKELYNKLNERNLLFLLIPFGLLFVMMIAIIFISFSQPVDPNQTRQKPSSPKLSSTLSIENTSPQNNAINVGIFSPIRVTFTTPVSKQNQSSINISLNPTVTGEQSWSSDNKTLIFTPSGLANDQVYAATVSYKQNVFTWKFKIVSVENTSQEDQEKSQTISDENYIEQEKSVDQSYPWLENLPLQTDDYFFYFDIDTKSFVGQLYTSDSSTTAVDDQVAVMKQEILNQVKALGIPTQDYPIDWQVAPKS